MNLDDESLLSAYLDDELDPADRLAVEWSIETNPPLAEQFRLLVQMRNAVSSLPRPSIPCDLAPVIDARLAINRRRERIKTLARPASLALVFSGFFSIAASLIFALILLNHSLHDSVSPAQLVDHPAPPSVPQLTQPAVHPTDPTQITLNTLPEVVQPKPSRVTLPQPQPIEEKREIEARHAVDGMLGQPHIRRILIATDFLEAPRVKDLIDADARKNPEFARITICQEIVIDPECAEAAVIYAVPMHERDRKAFVGQLARSFPNLVEETEETSPDVVTQLTEVGQIALFSGTKAAPLVEPPHGLGSFIANKAETPKTVVFEDESRPFEHGRPVDRGEDGKVVTSKPLVVPSTELKPGDRVTVLVWVVTRPSSRRL
jgi:hypothetical protein